MEDTNNLKLPDYSGGLQDYFNRQVTKDTDRSAEYSFHFRHKLISLSAMIKVIQDDPNTHLGKPNRATIRDVMIKCTTRGMAQANKIFPEITEILKLAREIDKDLAIPAYKSHVLMKQEGMISLNQIRGDLHFFPGKSTHQAILANYEYLGLTVYATTFLYFLAGIADYNFDPRININTEVEDILKDYKYQLETRLSVLIRFKERFLRSMEV